MYYALHCVIDNVMTDSSSHIFEGGKLHMRVFA